MNYFLLIRTVDFLGTNLLFVVRISNFFFVHDYLTTMTNNHQQQPTNDPHCLLEP